MAQVIAGKLVLMTIGCLDIGGAERRLLQLARSLRARNAAVRLAFFVVSGRAGILEPDFREAGCEIFHGRPGPAGMIQVANLCRHFKPDVLHANSGTAGGFYCLAAKAVGVRRTISHIRSAGPTNSSGTGKRGMIYEPLTGFFSDLVIGVSEAAMDGKRFGRSRKEVIYNGLDREELAIAETSEPPRDYERPGPNFVVLGRLDRLKNVPHAVSAFAHFVKQNESKTARLHLVGPEGNVTTEELKGLARDTGLADQVIFHGPTSEPLRFLFHADCALLASDFEGLPGAALEALSCGTPVVASDIASNREVMRHAEGIEVIPVSNMVGWVAAMSRALKRDRTAIQEHFWSKSPFSLDQHTTEIMAAWGIEPESTRL